MATYTNGHGNVFTFDDGQPDFDSWIRSDAARESAWQQATEAYSQYKLDNDGARPTGSDCDKIFQQWVDTVKARQNS